MNDGQLFVRITPYFLYIFSIYWTGSIISVFLALLQMIPISNVFLMSSRSLILNNQNSYCLNHLTANLVRVAIAILFIYTRTISFFIGCTNRHRLASLRVKPILNNSFLQRSFQLHPTCLGL